MIVNKSNSKDFLRKDLPTRRIREQNISSMWENIEDYVNMNVDAVNELNDDMLTTLDYTASNSKTILNKVRALSTLLADLYAIGGASSYSHTPFDDGISSQSSGVDLNKDLMTISLRSLPSNIYTPSTIDISTRNGQLGNSKEYDVVKYRDIENIVGSSSRLEIESFDSELMCSVIIDLGSDYAVNNIFFSLTNLGVRLPRIESIESSIDGRSFTRQNIQLSNSNFIELDNYRFNDNNISLDLSEFRCRFIKINFLQKYSYLIDGTTSNRFAIGINGIRVGFNSSQDTGNIVLGPFKSSSQILKASVAAEVQRLDLEERNVSFEFSHNLETWFPIENSKIFDPSNDINKVVNFNTIDANSVSTEDPVQQIYLRISMSSIDASHVQSSKKNISRFRSVLSTGNRTIHTGNSTGVTNVFKVEGFKYGGRTSAPIGKDVVNRPSIVDIRSGNNLMPRSVGIENSDFIDVSSRRISSDESITMYSKPDKCSTTSNDLVICNPTHGYDPYDIDIYKYSKPLNSIVSMETRDREVELYNAMPILPISNASGIYSMHIGEYIVEIDLSEGFFYSASQLSYNTPDSVEEVEIYDEIGQLFSTVKTKEIAGYTVLDLTDAFDVSIPSIADLEFNHMYPFIQLAPNEFTIIYGKVLFGTYFKGRGIIPRVNKELIDSSSISSINDSSRLVLSENKQIKAKYSLTGNDLKKTVKLNHTNITEGTVRFDISNASINAFIKEVPFINGDEEFNLSDKFVQTNNYNKNVIILSENYLDNNSIEFTGANSIFLNRVYSEDELIEEGDWLLDTTVSPRIHLPEGIRTDDVVDVEILYDVTTDKISTSGLYSIDYSRGILHTVSPIDHRTSVSYMYGYIYAEYEALRTLGNKEYTKAPSSVTITSGEQEDNGYMVVIAENIGDDNVYKVSPIISDLRINIITAEDFL